jgi:hypothetical protein
VEQEEKREKSRERPTLVTGNEPYGKSRLKPANPTHQEPIMKKSIQMLVVLTAFVSTITVTPAFAQGTAFTYQGQLNSGGSMANGSYDLTFTLYSTNVTGTAIAGPVTNSATAVTNGLFTATIDFGGVFTGTNYWLEITVSTNGANSFTTLAPRQAITPTPYAVYSTTAGDAATAGTASSVAASNLTGTLVFTQLPATVVTNGSSVTLSGTFTGNGSGLTNLNTTNLVGTVADAQLSTNVALLNGTNFFTGTNHFAGVVIVTNVNNQITGSFTGNGGGLTNLNTANLVGSGLALFNGNTSAAYAPVVLNTANSNAYTSLNMQLVTNLQGAAFAITNPLPSSITNYTINIGAGPIAYVIPGTNACFNAIVGTFGSADIYVRGPGFVLWPSNCPTANTNYLTLVGTNWEYQVTNLVEVQFTAITNLTQNPSLTNVFVSWLGFPN